MFDLSNNNDFIDVKMDGSVLEEKSSFMIWSWPFLNWIGVLILSLLLKLSPRKFDLWCVLWSFFLLRLLCISISLPYAHLWTTVVTPGLVPVVASELAQLVPLPFSRGRSTLFYSNVLHDFSVTIPRCYKDIYINNFFPCTARLWNFLPRECFPLTYNLNGFMSRFNRQLLIVVSF